MAKSSKKPTENGEKDVRTCLEVANGGIRTGRDLAKFMSAMIGDLASGVMAPPEGNAICNASGKLLRIVELQHRYGRAAGQEDNKVLDLIGPEPKRPVAKLQNM